LAHPDDPTCDSLLEIFRVVQRCCGCADVMLVDLSGEPRLSLSGGPDPRACALPSLTTARRDGEPILMDLHAGPDARPHMSVIVPMPHGEDTGARPVAAVLFVSDARTSRHPLIEWWPIASQSA